MIALSLILILVNVLLSYKGFRDALFYDRYKFNVEKILVHKEYYRVLTAGFLHVGWGHLIWNMVSLYAFSGSLEYWLGIGPFLLIYFISLLGGNLFALFVHRHHSDYTSVGASGGVNGIIFAAIALFPGMKIGLFLLPLSIPAWIFGLVYIVYSIYGIRGGRDGIGHEAHLAGALMGMFLGLAIYPRALSENYLTILLLVLPTSIFIASTLLRPHGLLLEKRSRQQRKFYTVDDRYNAEKVEQQKELDRILDKIARKGMGSLTRKEKEMLDAYSRTVR